MASSQGESEYLRQWSNVAPEDHWHRDSKTIAESDKQQSPPIASTSLIKEFRPAAAAGHRTDRKLHSLSVARPEARSHAPSRPRTPEHFRKADFRQFGLSALSVGKIR